MPFNTNESTAITDLHKDYLFDAVSKMGNNIYLVDKTHGCNGVHFNVSLHFPTLAIIFKSMLLGAIQDRVQTLTVEFDDCTTKTTISYPEQKQ